MFFIFAAVGLGEGSLPPSLEPTSVTTLLCVIIVTVAMVLLTLMCVCSKKTASVKIQNDSAPGAEIQVKLKHLSKTEDIENQMTEAKTEETDDGKSAESLPEGSIVPLTSTTQQAVTHLKEETRPASHPSPHLPPRNPHNFHASTHPNSQVSSRTSTPVSVEKVHDDHASSRTTAASSVEATGGAMATKESQPPDNSWMPCRVQPDYEEMDLPDKTPSSNAKADECDDTNIYQDIDLNQETSTQKTATKNSDSIEPYAEFKEDSKKSSVILRPQRNSSSLQTSESDAANGIKSSNETPKYAKVDKSRKSQLASSNSSLANHLPEDGLASQEVATNGESGSSAPTANVTEIYTQVHKPKANVAVSNEHDKDSHVSNSHESANGENSKPADGDMVLNPCYESTMLRNYPTDTTSGNNSTQALEVPTAEESPYSTINDERVNVATNPDPNVTTNPDPGYSSIYEVQGASSAAAANAAGVGNSSTDPINSPKEPIYELVDATATDDVLSQRL